MFHSGFITLVNLVPLYVFGQYYKLKFIPICSTLIWKLLMCSENEFK